MKTLFLTLLSVLFIGFFSYDQCDATYTSTHIACDSVWFVPNQTGSNYSYYWDFGDGATSTAPSPAHQYSADGSYTVVLTIVDSTQGCSNAYTTVVNVNCGSACSVTAAFTWYVDSMTCDVSFLATAGGGTGPYNFYWEFGDGATGTSTSPIHQYPNNTSWTPCLTVTGDNGCDTTICEAIYVNCANSCDAQFTYTHVACDSIWFYPAVQGSQYTYSWDFGDGTTSNAYSPSHQYSADGTYPVVLTVSDSLSGCSDTYTMNVTVSCGFTPCTTDGAISWYVDSTNCEVNFTSTAFGGTAPYTYYWNFGDGNTSNAPHPTHQYPNNTSWTPCLTITDANGCDTTICEVVNVNCSASSCDAQFTYTHVTCDSIWFYPAVQGSQYNYSWDFGDGATSNAYSPSHQYSADGTYAVVLTVFDSLAGCSDTYTMNVVVSCGYTPCTTNGAISWYVDSTNCEVNFVSTAFNGTTPYTYYWNFGDGYTSSAPHPTHQYPNNSTWTPCLTITDANGCDTTICEVVSVTCNPSPCDAQFTYTHVTCDSVWFYPSSSGSQYIYSWYFGDGSYSSASSPSHQFSNDGTYTVELIVTDTVAGCTDSMTMNINIACNYTPCSTNGAFAWNVDSMTCEVNFTSTAYGGAAPYTYFWDFGDGNSSSNPHPIHQYPNSSTWTPCLTITDMNGCDTTICEVINVNCNPSPCDAQFTVSHVNCDSVFFYPNTQSSQYTYMWNFGDGASSSSMNPTHQYSGNGTYYVVLSVIDSANMCSNSYTYPLTINCNNNCTINAITTYGQDSTDCSVLFASSVYGGAQPYSYHWDFGDGDYSNQPNPTHQYPTAGPYTACLTVSDSNNCDTSSCIVVYPNCNTQNVSELSKPKEVQVYPNPSTGVFTIELPETSSLKVYNLAGELVFKLNNYTGTYNMDLSAVPSGVYLLKVVSADQTFVNKLVKKKE